MSDLEAATVPILEPMMMGTKRIRLSPQDQETLATWAFKTALVADFIVNEKRTIPADTYRKFYKRRLPPRPGAIIWTAATVGTTRAGMLWSDHAVISQKGRDGVVRGRSEAYLTTMSTFHAVFQVLGHVRGKTMPTKSPIIDRHIMRLWPPTRTPLDWPPALVVFSERELSDFARRTEFSLGDPI